jgi:hypothetical protein
LPRKYPDSSMGGRKQPDEKGPGWRVSLAAWAFGLCFGSVIAVRIAHETHLQAFYLKELGMDPKTVGSLWTLYFFWVGACEPTMGIVIDALRDRGIFPSTLIILLCPIWSRRPTPGALGQLAQHDTWAWPPGRCNCTRCSRQRAQSLPAFWRCFSRLVWCSRRC